MLQHMNHKTTRTGMKHNVKYRLAQHFKTCHCRKHVLVPANMWLSFTKITCMKKVINFKTFTQLKKHYLKQTAVKLHVPACNFSYSPDEENILLCNVMECCSNSSQSTKNVQLYFVCGSLISLAASARQTLEEADGKSRKSEADLKHFPTQYQRDNQPDRNPTRWTTNKTNVVNQCYGAD